MWRIAIGFFVGWKLGQAYTKKMSEMVYVERYEFTVDSLGIEETVSSEYLRVNDGDIVFVQDIQQATPITLEQARHYQKAIQQTLPADEKLSFIPEGDAELILLLQNGQPGGALAPGN